MDNSGPAGLHEEGRLFNHIVTDVDNAVRRLDRAVHNLRMTAPRTREFRMPLVDHALAELSGQKVPVFSMNCSSIRLVIVQFAPRRLPVPAPSHFRAPSPPRGSV